MISIIIINNTKNSTLIRLKKTCTVLMPRIALEIFCITVKIPNIALIQNDLRIVKILPILDDEKIPMMYIDS